MVLPGSQLAMWSALWGCHPRHQHPGHRGYLGWPHTGDLSHHLIRHHLKLRRGGAMAVERLEEEDEVVVQRVVMTFGLATCLSRHGLPKEKAKLRHPSRTGLRRERVRRKAMPRVRERVKEEASPGPVLKGTGIGRGPD